MSERYEVAPVIDQGVRKWGVWDNEKGKFLTDYGLLKGYHFLEAAQAEADQLNRQEHIEQSRSERNSPSRHF